MSLNAIFESFAPSSGGKIEEYPERKVTLVKDLLTPALEIFTKVTSPITTESFTRLTDIEKKELLEKSILNKKKSKAIKSSKHMTSLLGQIHADALASNNSLEQLPSHEGAKAWAGLVREVEEVVIPKDLQTSLDQYANTSAELSTITEKKNGQKVIDKSKKITESIHGLKEGESFLLEGGRRKSSIDRPVVFEFIRTAENSFDLFVYLPGKKEDFREQVSERGKKTWNHPVIHYQNIPADSHLFFGNGDSIKSDFFQSILEARFGGKEFSPSYITLHLLAHLQSFRKDLDPVISGRMASTEAWSSLKPFVLRKLGRENYCKAILDIRLNSLIQGYQQAKETIAEDTPEAEKLRIVLRRGARLIFKNLASLHNRQIDISENFSIQARATALDLIDVLDRIEENISTSRKEKFEDFSAPVIDKATLQGNYAEAVEKAKKSVKEPSASSDSIHCTRARLIDLPQPEDFPAVIEQFVNEYSSNVKVAGVRTAEIEHLAALMPIPNGDAESYWNKIPSDKLLSTLTALDTMIDVYSKAISKKTGITAKEANVAYTLFAVIHHLALAQDRVVQPDLDASHSASLSHYPIYFPGMETDKDPYLLFTSPEDYARREELIAYFKESYEKTKEYDSKELFNLERGPSFIYNGSQSSRKEKPEAFLEYLLALTDDPRFEDQHTASALADSRREQIGLGFAGEKVRKGLLASKLVSGLKSDESWNAEYDNRILSDKGFDHLPILARSAIISHIFTSRKDYLDRSPSIHTKFNFHTNRIGIPYGYYLSVEKVFSSYDRSRGVSSSDLHPVLRKDQKDLLEKEWIKRNKSTDTSKQEAEVLAQIEANQSETTDALAFLRSSCEPSLFPHKLLSYYRGKLSLFESFEEQTLFELALYRSAALEPEGHSRGGDTSLLPYQRSRFLPIAEEIQQKGFQEEAKLFIQEGIDRYFFRQPNQKPKVLAATLFIRLACRLSRFMEGAPLVDSVDLIEKMMAVPSNTPEERSLLSIHLVLAYSSLQRELTNEEVEKAFGAWVYYKNSSLPEEWRNSLLEREAEKLIHKASASFSEGNNLAFKRSILKTALKQLGIELPPSFTVSATEPHLIEGKGSGSDFWTVNILTGEVMSADGILRRTLAPRGLQNETFKYIFGDINPSYFETQGCFYFSHPTLGTFRALKTGYYYYDSAFNIQKLVGSQWYQYIAPQTYLKSIPRFLCGNNTHWINSDSYSSDMIICSRDTGAIVAKINQLGRISSNDRERTFLGVPPTTFLSAFERPEYIHWSEDKQGKKTLTFWRYQSHAHNPLTFELEGNSLVYTANRKYILSAEQKPGLLGAKNGSLVLVNRETGAERVIVAAKPLTTHTPLSTLHEIDVTDQHVGYSSLGEFYTDQKSRFEFHEFEVKQGSLAPLTLEGTLYLSYQYFVQRRYAEAFYWLKQIDYRDQILQSRQESLTRIIYIASSSDSSPEAAAVALHAWVLLEKATGRVRAEGNPCDSSPSRFEICAIYSRFEHQIPENFLLNADDQKLCGLTTCGEKRVSTYPDIQEFLPSPHRAQEEISSLAIEYADIIFGTGEISIPGYHSKWQWETIVEEAKSLVYDETEFVPLKPKPSNFHEAHFHTNAWTIEFEQGFFTAAYEIARGKEGTELDRKLLAFRMQLIEETGKNLPKSWKYLQLALKYPEEAPDLPDAADYKARLDFINQCADLKGSKKGDEGGACSSPAFSSTVVDSDSAPERPIAAPILPPRVVEEAAIPLQLSPFSKEVIDGGFTQKFFGIHFEPKDKKESPKIGAPVCPEKSSLETEEKEFFNILQAEFAEFAADYEEGKKINEQRQFYTHKDPKELRSALGSEITTLDSQLALLESSILELANKHDPDERKTTLYKEVKIQQELSLKRLVDLFLQGDADTFAKANSYLRNPQLIDQMAKSYGLTSDNNLVIDYLYNQIALYMTISVHKERLKRSKKLCGEIEPLKEGNLKRDALVQKLAEELKPIEKPVYSINEYPAFLVFEYLSGLSIRQEQADLLAKLLECEDGKYIPRVIQLIMGGGKTSVMAVILLKLAAKKGRLSLFVTPASQYASVSYNLRKTLRDCFGIDMEEIDVTREQLGESSTMCEEILTRLQNAVKAGDFLLIKSETLQTVGLEFLDFVYQAAKDPVVDVELISKINTLKDILVLLREKGDALFDEVDLLLNVLQEVNFPVGEMEFISPERIEVIRQLFLLFMGEEVRLDDSENSVNLKALIGLDSNSQNLLSQELWKGDVSKAVAYNLSRTMESLKLQERLELCSSFERYINGTMKVDCQRLLDESDDEKIKSLNETDQQDYQFLNYVKQLSLSSDLAEQEAAHHIALIKHMMQSVLPVTFEKTGKRNYGRGGTLPGEVRPYLAVDTPSENLFGYHWEAVTYHFQTAVQCGISREQMLHIAKLYKEQAEIQAEREKRVFDQTMEAIEFKDMTGVALHELDDPKKVDEAIINLNKNIDALLRFEADTAAEYVSYYPLRLTSTGQSLVSMLSTVRAMSGTPWNTPCYPSSLSENFEPAVGTEGQIAEAVLSRAASKGEDKTHVHVIESKEIKEILTQLLEKHPQKERVRILLDSGALFKNYSNFEVAQAIRDYLDTPELFFMRNPHKKEKTPDTLALLRVGSDQPDIIGGTRLEDIQKTGLNVEDYFVFNDERHTTGTDIPYIHDVIGLMTLDEAMLRRSLFQTIMREREFFLNQEVEFVLPAYLLGILNKSCPDQEFENEDIRLLFVILILSIKNQAIAKSKHYYRSCKQKIDAVFKQNLLDEFLGKKSLTHEFIQNCFPAYQSTTLTAQADNPYDQFGALEYPVDSLTSLEAYRARKLRRFPQEHGLRADIEEQTQKIVDEAKKSPYRPATVLEAGSHDIGMQVDVLTEVASQVNVETDQDVDQEILRELETYQKVQVGRNRAEKEWTDREIETFLRRIKEGQEHPLRKLSFLLSEEAFPYQQDYSKVFSSGIRVTDSWALATKRRLPVFHKMQRPLDQIVIVKDEQAEYHAIALSQKEAYQFKRFFLRNPTVENVWIIQPDGSHLQDTGSGPIPIKEGKIQQFLVECNVFNGRIDYLDSHEEYSSVWLHEDSEKRVKSKKNFLQLKVAKNPLQKKLFFNSELFGDARVKEKQKQYRWRVMAKEMESLGQAQIQAFTEKDAHKLKWLPPKQLNMVKSQQVKLLKASQVGDLFEPALIREIPEGFAKSMQTAQMKQIALEQVSWFSESVTKTQAMPPSLCKHMTDGQIKLISPSQLSQIEDKDVLIRIGKLEPSLLAHVSGTQVKSGLIDESMVPHLRKKEAIEELDVTMLALVDKSLRQKHLKSSQVAALSPEDHKELIHDLTEAQVKWLITEAQLRELTEGQKGWMSPFQIAQLKPEEQNASVLEEVSSEKKKRPAVVSAPATTITKKEDSQIVEVVQNRSITKIVLISLAALVAAGIMVAGGFALMGALWINAPQFTVVVYNTFQSSLFMPTVAAGGGALFLVGLITYAIYKCCRPQRSRVRVDRAAIQPKTS